jgi:isocitrate/isopropylmalate dehydrogenase
MSRPFSTNSAKPAFAKVNESMYASSYIQHKKNKYIFCSPTTICKLNQNVGSQSNLLLLKRRNYVLYNNFDKTQLYSNLYTKLDLSGNNIPIISDLSENLFPVNITTDVTPYLTYNIDPAGYLFGNTPCGINNYLHYVIYNDSFNKI